MKSKTIPQEIYDAVEAEMLEGEQLLWVGLPDFRSAVAPNRRTLKIGTLMAIMLGLVVSFLPMVMMRGGTIPFTMSPMLWTMMGLIVLLFVVALGGRFLQTLWQNRGTIYAVTDQRALIIRNQSVQSYGENDMDFIERHMRGSKGDIIFKREARSQSAYYGEGMYGRRLVDEPIGFFGIENPREVEALMLQTFRVRGDNRRFEKVKHEASEDSEAPLYDEDKEFKHLSR